MVVPGVYSSRGRVDHLVLSAMQPVERLGDLKAAFTLEESAASPDLPSPVLTAMAEGEGLWSHTTLCF